jgi:hypothetical protein
MNHPLAGNLKVLSDKELHEKYTVLQKRYWQATSESMKNQIQLLIESYLLELETRKKNNSNEELDSLIKIS